MGTELLSRNRFSKLNEKTRAAPHFVVRPLLPRMVYKSYEESTPVPSKNISIRPKEKPSKKDKKK
jgi:hypothetical protein